MDYSTHPEPGKPDHLATADTFTFLSSYSTYASMAGRNIGTRYHHLTFVW